MYENLSLIMDDRINININVWKPQRKEKAVIVILHGMAEHSMRYENFASFLASNGYIVYIWDQRGHGLTGKKMGSLGFFNEKDGWNRVTEDIKEIIKWIKSNNKDLELFLLGHSMGSLLARTCIQNFGNEFKGVILSGTTLGGNYITQVGGKLLAWYYIKKYGLYAEATKLDNIVFGNFNKNFKPSNTKFDWLSKDEKKVHEYVDDELCGFICTTAFFRDLFYGVGLTYKNNNIDNIPKGLPILLFSGDMDPASKEGKEVKKLYEKYKMLGIKDLSMKLYKNGRHEMLNETNRDEVYQDILHWLQKYN